jgi:hypothetical protein
MKEMGAFATSAAPAASEAMSAQFSKYLERMRSSFAH